jgi:hypothetical protein
LQNAKAFCKKALYAAGGNTTAYGEGIAAPQNAVVSRETFKQEQALKNQQKQIILETRTIFLSLIKRGQNNE